VAERLDSPDEIDFRFEEYLEENKQTAYYFWGMKPDLSSLLSATPRAL